MAADTGPSHDLCIMLSGSALGADCFSTPRIDFAIERKKETINVLLFTQKTRIRKVRRTSNHFPTTKVDFITN